MSKPIIAIVFMALGIVAGMLGGALMTHKTNADFQAVEKEAETVKAQAEANLKKNNEAITSSMIMVEDMAYRSCALIEQASLMRAFRERQVVNTLSNILRNNGIQAMPPYKQIGVVISSGIKLTQESSFFEINGAAKIDCFQDFLVDEKDDLKTTIQAINQNGDILLTESVTSKIGSLSLFTEGRDKVKIVTNSNCLHCIAVTDVTEALLFAVKNNIELADLIPSEDNSNTNTASSNNAIILTGSGSASTRIFHLTKYQSQIKWKSSESYFSMYIYDANNGSLVDAMTSNSNSGQGFIYHKGACYIKPNVAGNWEITIQ